MKFAILFMLGIVFAGCGASQIRDLAESSAANSVCTPVCGAQSEFDAGACTDVCENVANTSRKVLKDPTFDGIFDVACDVACSQQKAVPPAVCAPICNFLANSGKSMISK